MTELQKQRIVALRRSGLGYKKIAAVVGVSRDSVRYCCKNSIADSTSDGEGCRMCGGSIEHSVRGRKRFFCSENCRRKWWSAHPEMRNPKPGAVYTIICAGCGTKFESYGNRSRKYCSHGCFVKSRWPEQKSESNIKGVLL
ncbi:MAG: hypothetical protein BWY15_01968 [Firmicutes bacterium ADurb.Bin193]|nr:MAG: hypothetical protein BWY15_01968 [Firmicutes bacterium ADurb.Bin193]